MKMKNNMIKRALIILFILVCFSLQRACATAQDSITSTSITYREYLHNVGQFNLNLLAEKYNVKIAEAEISAAKVMPDPQVNFESTYETYTVELEYSLELGNKRGARVRLAKSQAEHTELVLNHFFQELRAEATDVFLDAILQRELLKVKQSSYNYMLQLSHSDSLRFQMGEINENDARQSKLEAATLLNEVFNQEAEHKASLMVLNQYMGKASEIFSVSDAEWGDMNRDYVLGNLISIASENRLDLMAAQKNLEVVTNQFKLIRAERRMDLGLKVGYERDWHGIFPTRRSLKAGVTIPLKFSKFNKGSLRVANYAKEQSECEAKNLYLQVQTEVSQAFYRYEAIKKQVKQYQTGLLDDSKRILDGMVYKYKRGETSILDVLIAQRTYNEVQEQYLGAMKDYVSALVNLEKACGMWDIDF